MKRCLFEGVCVALVTPFKNGLVDYDAMKNLIEFQIENGVSAISVLGTTGEPCTLTEQEKFKIIKFCAKVINKRVTYIVGTGGNCTKDVLSLSKFASLNGADGLLVVTPYYNKCSQKGLVKYYNSIASEVSLPIIVYNVPSRTGVNVLPSTLAEIAKNPFIYGFKQASSNMQEIIQIFENLNDKIAIYSGEDFLNYVFYALGGSGAISVTANAYPKEVSYIFEKIKEKNYPLANLMQSKLSDINRQLFCEVNPIPIKKCLSILGLCSDEVREPLLPLSDCKGLVKAMTNLSKVKFK